MKQLLLEVKKIVKQTPRASFANPRVAIEDGAIIVRAGSSADACRFIEALRNNGYTATVSPYDWRVITCNK